MRKALLILSAFALLPIFSAARPTIAEEPPVVCIDPGHPSETSAGNVVQNGTTEVHIAWVVALKLRALLEAKGMRTVMTKSAEARLVRNRDRAMIANRARARLMVRLHCDASNDSGFALYAPDRQGSVEGVTGPSPEVIERSQQAARAIHQGMAERLAGVLKDGGVRGDSKTYVGSRQGALTGSIFSEVPVVTVEMVVLSNKSDARFIKDEKGQNRMAEAIAAGIERFIKP
jgi:N-acetylmuramoyl-L-alanine amidase